LKTISFFVKGSFNLISSLLLFLGSLLFILRPYEIGDLKSFIKIKDLFMFYKILSALKDLNQFRQTKIKKQ